MALDAHALSISASRSCAELESLRSVDTENTAKPLSSLRGSKKKYRGQGGIHQSSFAPSMLQVFYAVDLTEQFVHFAIEITGMTPRDP